MTAAVDTLSPYAAAAPVLWAKGWRSPLPIPARSKGDPPTGWTGHNGLIPSWADIQAWIDNPPHQDASVVLRLPDGVLGLDVDHYNDKHGGDTLADRESRWGPLRPTWRSTSRTDDVNGIRLFRTPLGLTFDGKDLTDIDLITYYHRYLVVAPSLHKDSGDPYQWYGPDGQVTAEPPALADLPALPDRWVAELTKTGPSSAGAKADLGEGMNSWVKGLPGAGDAPCAVMMAALGRAMTALQAAGSRHDTMTKQQVILFRLADEGHPGALQILNALGEFFVTLISDRASAGVATAEFRRGLEGAAAIVAASPSWPRHTMDPCLIGTGKPTPVSASPGKSADPPAPVKSASLDQVHVVFRRWLGQEFDTEALDVVLAAAAVDHLDGDPLWLLVVSGSGNAKTETVQPLSAAGATVISSISSEGALLSATSRKERSKAATGGLLRALGSSGVLVIKDVTTILSMDRTARGQVLAALREIHDGRWSRNVGTDGGQTLEWTGRLVVIGAVTTAWDQAREVVAAMGDRFVLVRMDSTTGRVKAGRRAIGNTGDEIRMRADLGTAVAGLLSTVVPDSGITVTDEETEILLTAADVVTRTRTGVIRDYKGDVIDAHAPEMPTRFAKQLTQVVRGGVAIGMDRRQALRLAIRCARDSMPPLRLAIVDDLAAHPNSPTRDVRKRLGKPWNTVDRELQALHMLAVVTVEEEEVQRAGKDAHVWRYRLTEGIQPDALSPNSVPELLVYPPSPLVREVATERNEGPVHLATNNSGTESEATRSASRPLLCSCGNVAEAGSASCWSCAA